MTEPRASDARLVDAFQSLGEPDAELSDEVRDRIWLAVSGALPAEERREMVELTATNPSYAEAWRVAHEMWQASQVGGSVDGAVDQPRVSARWTPRWLAAAAAVVLGTTLAVTTLLNRAPTGEYRSSVEYRIGSLIPDDTLFSRGEVELRWTPGPAGTRYTVRVTTPDLQLLANAMNLDAPELAIAAATLETVAQGGTVLWQVAATLPDGERVMSDTFTVRVE